MSPEREVTIGELAEKVDDLATEVRESRRDARDTFADKALYDERIKNLGEAVDRNNIKHEAEIRDLEQRLTWIGRTAVSAMALPILVFIVAILYASVVKP